MAKDKSNLLPAQEKMMKNILESLEKGRIPWQRPWKESVGVMYNVTSGNLYRRHNQMLLQMQANMKGLNDPRWVTFKEAQDKGWRIKKGATSSVIFTYYVEDRETKEKYPLEALKRLREEEQRAIRSRGDLGIRHIDLFNGEQVDGIPELKEKDLITFLIAEDRIESYIDMGLANMNLRVDYGARRAAYVPAIDSLEMPDKNLFINIDEYYGTQLHEMGHATGHKTRLNRFDTDPMRDIELAYEELVADISSALISVEMGLNADNSEQNTKSYIQSYIAHFKDKPEMFWKAVNDGMKVKEYLFGKMGYSLDYESLTKSEDSYIGQYSKYWNIVKGYDLNTKSPILYVVQTDSFNLSADSAYSMAYANEAFMIKEKKSDVNTFDIVLFYPMDGEIKAYATQITNETGDAVANAGTDSIYKALYEDFEKSDDENIKKLKAYLEAHQELDTREEIYRKWVGNFEKAIRLSAEAGADSEDYKRRLEYVKALVNHVERSREDVNFGCELKPEPVIDRYLKKDSREYMPGRKADLDVIKDRVLITEYAVYLGFGLRRDARAIYSLDQHDSCKIYIERNDFYRFSNGVGGTILDFIMEFEKCDFKDAVSRAIKFAKEYGIDLEGVQERQHTQIKERKAILDVEKDFPARNKSLDKVYEYLVGKRGIDESVVTHLIEKGELYEDVRNSCVFVNYNDEGVPNYGFVRGTSGDFKREIMCDQGCGFYINTGAKNLVITEGVIDALSHQCLSDDFNSHNYLAVGGTRKGLSRFDTFVEQGNLEGIEKVIVAFDSDESGLEGGTALAEHIKEMYPNLKVCAHIPNGKDFNEELIAKKGIVVQTEFELDISGSEYTAE